MPLFLAYKANVLSNEPQVNLWKHLGSAAVVKIIHEIFISFSKRMAAHIVWWIKQTNPFSLSTALEIVFKK